jgi:hypothetical protein
VRFTFSESLAPANHPREHRHHEHDDDEKDLPRYADGGVACGTDEMTDERVVDEPLCAADDVLQHGGPRQLPHGVADRPFDDGTVEARRRRDDHGIDRVGGR